MRGAGGHVTPEARLNFLQNRATVGVVSEPDNRKQHGLLKRTENIGHIAYIVGKNEAVSRQVQRGPTF
jgi:hypothetical protein